MFKKPIDILISKKYKKATVNGVGRNPAKSDEIPDSINNVKEKLQQEFSLCSDFIVREVLFGKGPVKIIIAFLDGFVDKKLLEENVIKLVNNSCNIVETESTAELLRNRIIASGSLSEMDSFSQAIEGINEGEAIVFIDGEKKAFKIGIKAPEKRAVNKPETEMTTKGSRESFSEDLRTNTVLLRRRVRNQKLKIEIQKKGEVTKTQIAICYIEGIAKQEIIDEVKNRIGRIKQDSVIDSGYLEQHIEDGIIPFFPMVGNSEKPDKVAAKLLEGRVAIMVDGTPTVITVPFLLIETIQVPEDYYGEYYFASFTRVLRLLSFFISIYLPSLYVALTAFHQTVIPFKLMLTMAATREGIPFSAFTEAILMTVTFEILREASVRMPKTIGQTVSIAGAIVLGEAAITAGIASAPLVIVAALTGICSFLSPPLVKPATVLRFGMLIAANSLGLLGIALASIGLLIYLCQKRSFGIPYLTPFTPLHTADLKDSLIVVPIWAMFKRPGYLAQRRNSIRTKGKRFTKGGRN